MKPAPGKWFSIFLIVFSSFYASFCFALPKFSLKEKKRCYYCHFNRNGGGPLNSKGKLYTQHRSFEVAEVSKKIIVAKREEVKVAPSKIVPPPPPQIIVPTRGAEEKVKPKEETLLAKTSLGADLLLSYIVAEERNTPQNFYLMKAEPLVTTQVADNFLTVFGYNFAAPVLTAYGQYQYRSSYIQLGSFHVPFGLDFLDYNNVIATLIKEYYDLALDTRDVGIEVGAREDFYGRLAIVNGAREPRERPTLRPSFDKDLGYIIDCGYQGIFFKVPFMLGSSFLVERRIPPGNPQRGIPPNPTAKRSVTSIIDLYGQLNYKNFNMLGEFTFGFNTPLRGDRSYGFYMKPSYNIYPEWAISARGELFARDRRFLGDSRLRFVVSSEYQFSKYVSIEPMLRKNMEIGNISNNANDDAVILLNMKF